MRTQPRAQKLRYLFITYLALSVLGPLRGEGGPAIDLGAVRSALSQAGLPGSVAESVLARIDAAPDAFRRELSAALADRAADPMLLYLVDKAKALPRGYSPPDLVALDGSGLPVSRSGHRLRKAALSALSAMEAAARKGGVTLLVSSAYRSFDYQTGVWDRGVAADGEAETEAGIARPGHSQHQLGTAIDFGSITDAFAETKASRWLSVNARRYGFSLSYPRGMTAVTGYRWESWHYRFIGKAAAALEGEYFGGTQQYLLSFLDGLR